MPLRLIEMRLPGDRTDEVTKALTDIPFVNRWNMTPQSGLQVWHILAHTDEVEAIVDVLEDEFSLEDDFRIILFNIEAAIPRPEDDEEEETTSAEAEANHDKAPISTEELYDDITHGMSASWNYVTMVAVSAVVAAVGIYRDDIILIIAAMIIAPLLHPNMALSLATTMADSELGKRAVWVNFVGLMVALVVSVVFGMMIPFEPKAAQESLRTTIGVLDIVVAASAGTAGALSFTIAKPGGVVGVMIAVALLPPLVSFGMLAGAGYWAMAVAPLLLVFINIICINLAGVVTFFIQRIHPRAHWEEARAEKAFRKALVLWLGLLALLGGIGYFSGEYWQAFW